MGILMIVFGAIAFFGFIFIFRLAWWASHGFRLSVFDRLEKMGYLKNKVVLLHLFDGAIETTWAHSSRGRLYAYRFPVYNIGLNILNPDGTTTGECYIHGWEFKRKPTNEEKVEQLLSDLKK